MGLPKPDKLKQHLSLVDVNDSPTPITILEIDDKIESFTNMKDIIARNVEQILCPAVLPHIPLPGSPKIHLINNLTQLVYDPFPLDINYEAIL